MKRDAQMPERDDASWTAATIREAERVLPCRVDLLRLFRQVAEANAFAQWLCDRARPWRGQQVGGDPDRETDLTAKDVEALRHAAADLDVSAMRFRELIEGWKP